MAYITEFTIYGLLGRKEPIHVSLNRHVNVFFGDNGCGKTTLLKILAAALDLDGKIMNTLPVTKAEVHIFSVAKNSTIKATWDATPKKSNEVALQTKRYFRAEKDVTPWKLSGPKKDDIAPGGWQNAFLQTNRLHASTPSTYKFIDSSVSLEDAFAESINRQWLRYYNKTLATVRSVQEDGLRAVLRHVLAPSLINEPPALENPEVVHELVERFLSRQSYTERLDLGDLKSFKTRYEKDGNLRRVVNNLGNVERLMEDAVAPLTTFLMTLEKLFRKGKKIQNSETELQVILENGNKISLSALSSGEKHLVKILLTAMNVGENCIIIDEPELSMHVDWQRSFVPTLQSINGDCQQILASHSPEVMADVADECIYRL